MDSSDSLHKSLSINLEERKVSNNLEEDLNNFTEKANNTLMDKLKKVPALGMIFGILSAVFQLGMFYNVKVLYNTTTLTSFEVIFIRGITDLTLTLIIWHFIGVDVIKIQKESRNPIKVRMFFAIASAFFIFLAYKVNPLSIATLLTYTSPIFTSIFAFFLLGEKMTKYDFINIVSCWIGVVLITNPFGTTGTAITLYGIIIGAFSSITMAGSFTMVRMVSITFHYFVPMFYYSLATTAFAPIAYMIMILFGHPATVLTSNEWIRIIHSIINYFSLIIVILTIFGFTSQLWLNISYKLEQAGRVSTVRYLQIVLTFMVDVIFFGTSFSVQEILGILCTVNSYILLTVVFNVSWLLTSEWCF